jgi:threonine/homoserine/homoserine lactone efflux protein
VKYLGAAYLIVLGIRTLLARDADPAAAAPAPEPLARIFRDGFVVNLLNPKTAVFFLAFLPQFVDPARAPVHGQILVLGVTFMALGILSDGLFALAAGAAGDLLRGSRALLRLRRWFTGLSFIGLGVTAALAGRK